MNTVWFYFTAFFIAIIGMTTYSNSFKAQTHAKNIQSRDSIISLGNTLVEYGQKNAGFGDTSDSGRLMTSSRSFNQYLSHILKTVYNITTPLKIEMKTNDSSVVATLDYKPKYSGLNWSYRGGSLADSIFKKRLNRGQKFTITITPTYFYASPSAVAKQVKGRSFVFEGVAQGYIKRSGE